MAILYESYEITDTSALMYEQAPYDMWESQIFTPSTTHTITSVQLKLYKKGSPGTFDVGIYAVDGDGHPTGSALCSGSIQGNDLGTSDVGVWTEITLGNGAILAAYKKYAIVCHITGGDANNYVAINTKIVGAYANGYRENSSDAGSSWTNTGYDSTFREYGIDAQYSPLILTPEKSEMWGW